MSTLAHSTSTINYQLLFESAPGCFLVLAPDFTIIAVSDAYLKATMTQRENILGKGIFEVFPDNPDVKEATGERNLRASLQVVLKNKVSDTMAIQKYDIRRPVSEGSEFEERYWSPINAPVLNKQGDVIYIIHRVEDVTEFVNVKKLHVEQSNNAKELQTRAQQMETEIYQRTQELHQAKQEAELANALKTRFFSNISHELRTPLTLIWGPVEHLLSNPHLSNEQRQHVELIKNNACILLKLVNDLLDITKLEVGQMSAIYSEIDAVVLVKKIIGNFETVAHDRQIAFTFDLPDVLMVQIDAEKLQRIIMNILSNAFKFTPQGGRIWGSLKLGSKQEFILSIADSGAGIPQQQRKLVFERFIQLENSHSGHVAGTGLGLSIVKEFTQLLQGSVRVDAAQEGGACFIVTLPIKAPINTPLQQMEIAKIDPLFTHPKKKSNVATSYFKNDGKQPTVLIVEDNIDLQQFMVQTLAEDFNLIVANDGLEGLKISISQVPDVIVTDIMMPKMTGDKMIEAIRKKQELNDIPIILLSARSDDALRLKLLQNGAHDFLTKPFSPLELKVRINIFAALKKARSSLKEQNRILMTTNQELESFSYSVSHDLRAPLRSIIGFSQILITNYMHSLDENGKDLLARIENAGEYMGQLIDGILKLSRLVRKPIEQKIVNLSNIVHMVSEELQVSNTEREVIWHIPDGIEAIGDKQLLQVALQNLLENAWKYSGRQKKARIEFGVEKKENKEIYFIRDNGVGFNMDHADKLFGAFQRLHAKEEFEGLGIGLATVQRIIHRHNGRIWAESTVNKGTTFYFTLC